MALWVQNHRADGCSHQTTERGTIPHGTKASFATAVTALEVVNYFK